jgi:hypothetical protein
VSSSGSTLTEIGTCGSAGKGCTAKVTRAGLADGPGWATAFKLIEAAQDRWRAVNAPHLAALVRTGARFERGILIERPEVIAARPLRANRGLMSPASSW